MCELMEQYLKEARQEGEQKGRQKLIQALIKKGCSMEEILGYDGEITEAEYNEAEQTLLVHS